MNKFLLVIDGSSILSTSFYGNLPKEYYGAKTEEERTKVLKKVMKTSQGIYTNGVFTMCKTLLKIIEKQKPTHLVVAWDITRDTFRKKLYPEYKGNRDEIKPELKSQFILMQDVLQAMGITQYMHHDYEADDIIGTVSKKFEEEIPTFILTKDQDALQLVDDYIRVWLITSKCKEMYAELNSEFDGYQKNLIPDNVFEFTPIYVEEFYGLNPIQIIDMKALEGEKVDNIPGVRGVGKKAVIPLLKEYGTVENLYDNIEDLDDNEEKQIKEFFKELGISRCPLSYLLKKSDNGEIVGKEAALLSKKLATIDTQMPEFLIKDKKEMIPVKVQDLKLEDVMLNINKGRMKEKFKELEFKSLI